MIRYESKGSVSDEDLTALEARLGHPLPPDYRAWLKENNGAYVGTLGVANGVVNAFAGVRDDYEGSGLVQAQLPRQESFGAWIPRDYLIVSHGAGGVVCVKVNGPGTGSVWWADYDLGDELAADDEGTYEPIPEIMSRVADSWTAFLAHHQAPALPAEAQAILDAVLARND